MFYFILSCLFYILFYFPLHFYCILFFYFILLYIFTVLCFILLCLIYFILSDFCFPENSDGPPPYMGTRRVFLQALGWALTRTRRVAAAGEASG